MMKMKTQQRNEIDEQYESSFGEERLNFRQFAFAFAFAFAILNVGIFSIETIVTESLSLSIIDLTIPTES